jgi:uncharacterized protein (TIGR01777 family)
MNRKTFTKRSRIAAPAAEVFAWHRRPGAFDRYNPPWEPAQVLERTGGIENGSRAVLLVPVGFWRQRWVAEHCDYQENKQFRDIQREGPFALWDHVHRLEPDGSDACFVEDTVEYALPLGPLGAALAGTVARRLEQTFTYRHEVLRGDMAAHQTCRERPAARVLVSGSHGLVGSVLIPFLTTGGHGVTRLVRGGAAAADTVNWDAEYSVKPESLEDFDAVIHLAGENIASGRWSKAKKAAIRDSRIKGTHALASALTKVKSPPRVLVCASAIGYYGDRGDEELTESSAPGTGFLADVCREWEEAARPAREHGIRTVHVRFGVILSPQGGALAKMLTPFRLGAGGRIGSGRQWMSWIGIHDAVGAIHHAVHADALAGPVNVVAPNPVTNAEFTRTLGRVLHRPTILPMPAFAARLALGEMANELLLSSQRVNPTRLLETGYEFRHRELEAALRHVLGRSM